MLFNSIEYFFFLPIVIILYFLLKGRWKIKGWVILLIASYYFYMSLKPEYVLLLILSAVVNYFAAIKIEHAGKKRKKVVLALAIIYNIGMLFAFKYFNFFGKTLTDTLAFFSIPFEPMILNLLLPIGISFYTFTALSYVIDVYRGKIPAEKHFGLVASFIAFFPTVLAGPIERAKNLIPQLASPIKFKLNDAEEGLKLILWGLFKKVVIADRLAIVVNTVYAVPTEYSGIVLILATIFFAFQIYIDFSAYSDIAIGSARILGFKLNENFKRPYLSLSFTEFWHRWHISLSTWFRDYLYIPLGGSRVSNPRLYANIMIVFIVSGLWHGANITFAVWGALHGAYILLQRVFSRLFLDDKGNTKIIKNKVVIFLAWLITFILVAIAWVFFRANNITDSLYILANMFMNIGSDLSYTHLGGIGGYLGLALAIGLIILLMVFELMQEKGILARLNSKMPLYIRSLIYLIIIIAIIFIGVSGEQFYYFSF